MDQAADKCSKHSVEVNGSQQAVAQANGSQQAVAQANGSQQAVAQANGSQQAVAQGNGSQQAVAQFEDFQQTVAEIERLRHQSFAGFQDAVAQVDDLMKRTIILVKVAQQRHARVKNLLQQQIPYGGACMEPEPHVTHLQLVMDLVKDTHEIVDKVEDFVQQLVTKDEGSQQAVAQVEGSQQAVAQIEGSQQAVAQVEGSLRSVATVIASSKAILSLTTKAAFGDAIDLFTKEPIGGLYGIYDFFIHVRRDFVEGKYVLHIVQTEQGKHVVIVCLENVKPIKIHEVLKKSDMGADFRLSNYLHQLDWMYFRSCGLHAILKRHPEPAELEAFLIYLKDKFGEDMYTNLAFFVDALDVPNISAVDIHIDQESDWIYVIRDKANRPIGFAVDSRKFFEDGSYYCHGCILADAKTSKYFAFVFGDAYTLANRNRLETDPVVAKQSDVNYTYRIDDLV